MNPKIMEGKAKEITYKYYQQSILDTKIFGEDSKEAFESYKEYRAVERAMAQLFEIDTFDIYEYCRDMYNVRHYERMI